MRYVHEKFELHIASRKLYFDGVPVQIGQRGIDILLSLIEMNGEVASKKELLEAIWPGEPANMARLVKQISLVRRSIENFANSQHLIVTVPGLGYRTDKWDLISPESLKPESLKIERRGELTDPGPGRLPNCGERLPSDGIEGESKESIQSLDIAPHLIGTGDSTLATSRRWQRLNWRQLILTLLVLLSAIYIFLSVVSQVEIRSNFGPSGIISARVDSGFKRNLKFSHDGGALAFYQSPEPDGAGHLYIVNLANNRTLPIPGSWNADEEIAWSPDNRSIAFLRPTGKESTQRQLLLYSFDGRELRSLSEVEAGGIDWAPNGQTLAVCDRVTTNDLAQAGPDARLNSGSVLIHILAGDGSSKQQLTRGKDRHKVIDSQPSFSPDGAKLAFIRHDITGNSVEIHLVDLPGGQQRTLLVDKSSITDLAWSADGAELLFISDRSGTPRLWRLSTRKDSSPGVPDLVTKIKDPLRSFSLSDKGELAYVCLPGNNSQIDLISLPQPTFDSLIHRQSRPEPVPCTISDGSSTYSPVFSPDGKRVAFISNRSGFGEIWVASADCNNHLQLTFLEQSGLDHLNWSVDGARIAFSQKINGQSDILYLELDSGGINRVTDTADDESRPVWSNGMEAIYFSWKREGTEREPRQIRRLNLTTRQIETIVEQCEGRFGEISNRSELYFARKGQLWCKNLLSGEERPLTGLDMTGWDDNWGLNQDRIYVITRQGKPWPALFQFDLSGRLMNGIFEKVLDLDLSLSVTNPGVAISPDGRRIATTSISPYANEIRFLKDLH